LRKSQEFFLLYSVCFSAPSSGRDWRADPDGICAFFLYLKRGDAILKRNKNGVLYQTDLTPLEEPYDEASGSIDSERRN
jgi:hypothetical protein